MVLADDAAGAIRAIAVTTAMGARLSTKALLLVVICNL
jgi:hypothetical protein